MSAIPIDKLTGRENFATWKIAVQAFLDLDDVWQGVVEPPPAEGAQVNAEKDRKARNKLKLAIDTACYTHIQGCTTARDIWIALCNAYEDNGLTRRCGLLRKLMATSYEECTSMEHYVREIIDAAQQLNNAGLKMSDEWIGMILLSGLPESYMPMVLALENSGMKITADAIKIKLLQEMPHGETSENALLSRRRKKKSVECYECGQEGHFARDCRNRDSEESIDRTRNALITVFKMADEPRDESWYFDSGASMHMTNDKEFIASPRKSHGKVHAANGRPLKIEAEGNVTLQLEDKEEAVDLLKVRFVPGLTANLISISEIVKKGLKVVFDETGCKVVRGKVITRGSVIATGERKGDLFRLKETKKQRAMLTTSRNVRKSRVPVAKDDKAKIYRKHDEGKSEKVKFKEEKVAIEEERKTCQNCNRDRKVPKNRGKCENIHRTRKAPASSISMQTTNVSIAKPSGVGRTTTGEYPKSKSVFEDKDTGLNRLQMRKNDKFNDQKSIPQSKCRVSQMREMNDKKDRSKVESQKKVMQKMSIWGPNEGLGCSSERTDDNDEDMKSQRSKFERERRRDMDFQSSSRGKETFLNANGTLDKVSKVISSYASILKATLQHGTHRAMTNQKSASEFPMHQAKFNTERVQQSPGIKSLE